MGKVRHLKGTLDGAGEEELSDRMCSDWVPVDEAGFVELW